MGKSYGRKEGEHGGHEPLSERVKGVAFFLDSALDGRFDRGAGAPNPKLEKDCCSVGASTCLGWSRYPGDDC